MPDIELVIKIPERIWVEISNGEYCGILDNRIYNAIKDGIPHETVTEFADRCRECGAKYGKLLKQKSGKWIEHFDESGKWYECNKCHTDWGGSFNYCPNCGRKMQEVEE